MKRTTPMIGSLEGSVVVGIGMSTHATRDEVAALVHRAIEHHGVDVPPVAIATRSVFVDDERLQLGYPVIGFDDDELIANSEPVDRTVGIPARVAETAAALTAGPLGRLAGPSLRSPHATVAVAWVLDVDDRDHHRVDERVDERNDTTNAPMTEHTMRDMPRSNARRVDRPVDSSGDVEVMA